MDDQNNLYSQQPQYIDPQAPYGQPQYAPAPVPDYSAPSASAEPEVIIQEIGFADYGFDENDSVSAGHDFGGFMDDDNSEPDTLDGFNIFNSQTPNFEIADVEAASKAATTEEKAMFTSTTVNFDLSAVEAAAHSNSETDREIFSNSFAVGAMDQTVSESPSFDAATAMYNKPAETATPTAPAAPAAEPSAFMSSMQSMFASMNGMAAAPAPAPVVETVPEPTPEPVSEPAPVFVAPAPVVEPTPDSTSVQEVVEVPEVKSEEKNPEYWNNIDKMLEGFEPKPASAPAPASEYASNYAAPAMPGAPAFNEAPVEAPAEQEEEKEAKKGFPFSESATSNNVQADATPVAPSNSSFAPATPAAPVSPVAPATPVAPEVPAVEEETPQIGEDDIPNNRAERAAKKAAKREAKAAKKEEKVAQKQKKQKKQGPSGFKGFIYKVLPNKDDSNSEIVRKVVVIVSVLALIVCAIYFLCTFVGSKMNEKDADKLAGIMTSSETTSSAWEDIYAKYPNVSFPSGMQAKFADIYAMNTDLVGWIRIPGLGIDYPVVQAEDDSYYLKRDFNKQSSAYGTVFLSSKNNYTDKLDLNTVIYGHAMRRDKQMFSRLHDYKDSAAFLSNPIIEFDTLYKDYKFKVYAVFITNGSSAEDNGYLLDYTFANLSSSESFSGFLAEVNQRKLYSTGVDILPTDRIITLSTCSYEFTNARLVVMGRMLRDGESEEVDASKVEVSNNPRYPQAWYDENKQSNPYASYAHWIAS